PPLGDRRDFRQTVRSSPMLSARGSRQAARVEGTARQTSDPRRRGRACRAAASRALLWEMPPGLREWFLQEWTWNQWTGVTSATSFLGALVYPLSSPFLHSATVSAATECTAPTTDSTSTSHTRYGPSWVINPAAIRVVTTNPPNTGLY